MKISRREFLGRSLKTGLALAIPSILTRTAKANEIYNNGKLEIINYVNDIGFDKGLYDALHYPGAIEGFNPDYPDGDRSYKGYPPGMNPVTTKIVSIIQGYEYGLRRDSRPVESFTPINLELSLHEKDENLISVSNLTNELQCSFPEAGWDFQPKPITLWRRFPAESDKLQFLADIREACAKQGGTGVIPLPNLNSEYQSQVPYDHLQVRFDVYPGNLNFSVDADGRVIDGIVDMKDLAILGNDWGKQGEPKEFVGDITGPQGLPDGKVDYQDLELFSRYWLKDIRDIMPSP